MTLAEIEAFLAVYRLENITKAAESQYISQSSLSLRLKTLERELGCELFVRGKGRRSLEPTQLGRRFYPLALEYIDLLDKMNTLSREESAVLHVSVINSLAECFFSPVFQAFLGQYEHCSLDVQDMDFAKATPALLSGEVDLSFTADACIHGRLMCTPLFREKMTVISSLRADIGETPTLSDLDPAKEIHVSWCSAVDSWHAETFGKNPRAKVSISVIQQLKYFFEGRDCWAIVPYSVADSLEKSGTVKIHKPEFVLPGRVIHYSRRLSDVHNVYSDALIAAVREHIKTTRPKGIKLMEE